MLFAFPFGEGPAPQGSREAPRQNESYIANHRTTLSCERCREEVRITSSGLRMRWGGV